MNIMKNIALLARAWYQRDVATVSFSVEPAKHDDEVELAQLLKSKYMAYEMPPRAL